MNKITERFVETFKSRGLTGYRMGKDCSIITKQKISNIEKGITDVSAEIISDFCTVYNDINANYILTGKGSMFLDADGESVENEVRMLEKLLDEKDKEIAALREQLEESHRGLAV